MSDPRDNYPNGGRQRLEAPARARLVDFKKFEGSGALVGKATIEFPGGWIVSNIPIFRRRGGDFSAGAPDAPMVTADGRHAVGDDGRKRYYKIITFKDEAAQRRWERLVLDCVTGEVD